MSGYDIEVPENQDELLTRMQLDQAAKTGAERDQCKKIVRAGIAKWVDNFRNGSVRIETVSDLRQLIELQHELEEYSFAA